MTSNEKRLKAPIIFIGPGRSGSTIVSEIVFAHETLAWPSNHQEYFPKLTPVNLLRPLFDNSLWRVVGEKGQLNQTRILNTVLPRPAEAYPFWQHLTRHGVDFSRGFLLGKVATKEEARRIRKVIGRMVAWQGKQRFAMKITGPGRIGYLQSIFPDALFVNVVRDPVATVHSLLKVPFWKDLGMQRLWWQGAYSEAEIDEFASIKDDPVAATAFQLAKVLRTTQEEALRCRAQMLTVEYESFVENPRACVEHICTFLTLPPSKWVENKLRQTRIHDRNHPQDALDKHSASKVLSFMNSVQGWSVAV